MNRRNFIKGLGAGLALTGISGVNQKAFAGIGSEHLVILHTNDFHSRMEPFPKNDPKYAGRGGVGVRKKLIEQVRKENTHVLLLDAGDIFQGTPYFNLFGGEPEILAMNEMKYDATAIGNHDFDGGLLVLEQAVDRASFPFLSHYQFQGSLGTKVQPYKIIHKGKLKIGVFGLGIDPDGLISPTTFGKTQYSDPIAHAQKMVHLLKENGVHLIIALSHLGYEYPDAKVSDRVLANRVDGIDLIIGGHTHTFLEKPEVVTRGKSKTLICQAGWAGLAMGRIDVKIDTKKVYFWNNSYTHF